ncbi:hypothetical protein [Gordonia tangerina]|uniref:RiboL-PSP-HEPN domain-containing protein n=1 Tax=Gordonia tangerina TaxID=2911060 RepID=A0ABS9DLW8_9ACTN|nr:hypothetical protein [Gordonia tangerina]MCF3939564.1 hypothetical protein [Gordonia tangerina]
MNRQSRAARWLRILETAEGFVESTLQALGAYQQRGGDIPPEGRVLLVRHSSDSIKLAAEADPPIDGTPLAVQLERVIERASNLDPAADFEATFRSLLEAIRDVLPGLRGTVVDDVQSAKDIVTELERSFMVSLTVSMTAHTTTLAWVKEWENAHMEYLRGKRADIGHYRTMRATNVDPENPYKWMPEPPNFWAAEPGPDRIHVQHLIAAIHSGSNMMVAGTGMRSFDYYPEVQTIQYGQWFAYMHAVWEEQFRRQLADLWSRGLPEGEQPFKPSDIVNDFFGDIRLIRNDFVHNKGEVLESVNLKCLGWDLKPGEAIKIEVERMVELMGKFPRVELLEPPSRPATDQKAKVQPRKNMPGSGKTELVDQFQHIISSNQLNKGRAIDEMLQDWINKHGEPDQTC